MILSALLIVLVSNFVVGLENKGYAHLELSANPGIIHPVLTKSFQLRCSLKKNELQNESTTSLLNFEDLPNSETTTQVSESTGQTESATESSKSQGEVEFSRLLSLVMTKRNKETGHNETIASVTGCDSPIIESKYAGTLQVQGNTEGSTREGEQGFITLTWESPLEEQAGEFQCEASVLNSWKHSVTIISSLEIRAIEPKMSDLVNYVSKNDKQIADLVSKVSDLYEENNFFKDKTMELVEENVYLMNKLSQIQTPMVQTGSFTCGSETIQFSPAFNSTPKIFISFSSMTIETSDYSGPHHFSNSVSSVTTTGCTVSCNYAHYEDSASFDWMAIGF